jgi:hypothetical protein
MSMQRGTIGAVSQDAKEPTVAWCGPRHAPPAEPMRGRHLGRQRRGAAEAPGTAGQRPYARNASQLLSTWVRTLSTNTRHSRSADP